jgi:glycosyltransferase involved in cell wall biosynthesis
MPNVLQVIQQGELRGAEVFALDLSGELARDGWKVGFLSLFGFDAPFSAAADAAGVNVSVARPDGHARGFDIRLAAQLRSVIDHGGYDVVQANGAATLKYLVAARRLSRRPWRLVYRAIGVGSFWRRGMARRLTYRWLLAQPDLIVAVCRAVADDLTRASGVDPRKVVVVPNGVQPARISSQPDERRRVRDSLGITPSERLLIYVGSLANEKNLGALVDAVAGCRREGVPVKALLVGDGPARAQLVADAARNGLGSAIQFLPAQGRVGAYFAAADLCVLPSLSEGMPAAVIEAGMAGLPAVAYAVGGVPEVIEDGVTGILLRAGDQAGLTGAVAALLRDDAGRAVLGRAAKSRYRKFEIATVAQAYRDAYDLLLEERLAG